jgi:hypothetical protein
MEANGNSTIANALLQSQSWRKVTPSIKPESRE